jgi:hypothetical protein
METYAETKSYMGISRGCLLERRWRKQEPGYPGGHNGLKRQRHPGTVTTNLMSEAVAIVPSSG